METKPMQLDVRKLIDEHPFSGYQILVVAMCAFVAFLDGIDVQTLAYVAPAFVKDLHISRAALGPLFSSGMFGMTLGSLAAGPIADRIGRKPVLLVCSVVFGLFTLLTAWSISLETIMIYRFITGLGLGGALPNAIALTAEYAPLKVRATAVMAMYCGFTLGGATGGPMAVGLMSRFGWRSVFVVGGLVPLAMIVVMAVRLPESIRFLVIKGGAKDKIIKYLSKIAPAESDSFQGASFVVEEHTSKFPVKELFTTGRTALTLSLWVMFFMNLTNLYLLKAWLPTILHDAGIPIDTAILITSLVEVGGLVGAIVLARTFDRKGNFLALGWTYLIATVLLFLIGKSGVNPMLLALVIFGAGFCIIGGQIGANALSAVSYPTSIRSTGVGWAYGVGRFGSILGPLLGGLIMGVVGDPKKVFFAAMLPMLIAATGAFSSATLASRQAAQEGRSTRGAIASGH